MSAATPSPPSGLPGIAPAPGAPAASARQRKREAALHKRSILNLRGSAVIVDGLIILLPILFADYVLAQLFPHRGFFWSNGTSSAGPRVFGLGTPGVLMATALSLSYFFVMEATRGQTLGKRYYKLRVLRASGGSAGANGVSGRTVLRLIDVLPFLYLGGAFVAIVTGKRRRRIGDWVGGTVVVREEAWLSAPPPLAATATTTSPPDPAPAAGVPSPPQAPGLPGLAAPQTVVHAFVPVQPAATGMPPMAGGMPPMAGTVGPPSPGTPSPAAATAPPRASAARGARKDWRIFAYPLSWVAAVLLATFALGLGEAEGAAEKAVALVRAYVNARDERDAPLACSMLTPAQQRELVALESENYASAEASACPRYVLENRGDTPLLSPDLFGLVVAGPSALGATANIVVVGSPQYPGLVLTAVREHGTFKLDTQGVHEQEFILGCERAGLFSASECECTYDRVRAEGPIPESAGQITQSWRASAQAAARSCRTAPAASGE